MKRDQLDALLMAILAVPTKPKRYSALRAFAEFLMSITIIIIGSLFFINLFLNAAIKEQAFDENIRRARCERMNDIERNVMKGYCK